MRSAWQGVRVRAGDWPVTCQSFLVLCLNRSIGQANLVYSCETYPLVVIDQAAPVQHVHHGLKAEDWLLIELVVIWDCQRSCCQLDGLVCLCPCNLLLPYLHKHD